MSPARASLWRWRAWTALSRTVSASLALSPRRQPGLQLEAVPGQGRNPDLRGDRPQRRVGAVVDAARPLPGRRRAAGLHRAVDLEEEEGDDLGRVQPGDLVGDPGLLAPDAASPHVEHLDGGLELVEGHAEDVGVEVLGEDHGVAFVDGLQGSDLVAVPGGGLVLLVRGGLGHRPLPLGDGRAVVALHEPDEPVDDVAVPGRVDPPHARRRAASDVPVQAGPARSLRLVELRLGAGSHGEDGQELVEGVADRPDLRVRPQVAGPPAVLLPRDPHPRELLGDRDRQVGVGLVVAEDHVEAGRVLLDPRILQRQCFDLGADHDPFDALRRVDHLPDARRERTGVLEVARQARPQALRLADVEDAPLAVDEAVDARVGGDRAGGRPVARGVRHRPIVSTAAA